jgi:uncharacterized membrane protein SpoIIM required for sporulation
MTMICRARWWPTFRRSLPGRTTFQFRDLGWALFHSAPRRLRHDPALRLAALIFWGVFLFAAVLAAGRADFARRVLPEQFLESIDHMYAQPVNAPHHDGLERNDTAMTGFYIQHNTSIGLQCYAWGILFGIGSIYQLFTNGLIFGTLFGYMTTRPHGANFFEFVTAHSAFELTAIIVASAAGMRLGWGLVDTQGQSRLSSLRREAANSLPGVGVSVVLFVLAALVEGYVSASSLPYWAKAAVAISSAAIIITFLALGGRGEPLSPVETTTARPLDRAAPSSRAT